MLRRRMLDFALSHRVPGNALVLAAKLELFSSREDFLLAVWWREGTPNIISGPGRLPPTVNGRSFPWSMGPWWEPPVSRGSRPLVFRTGSLQRLAHSPVELYPARLWATELGWEPDTTNPLVWRCNGERTAWLERTHGALRSNYGNGKHRQPLLTRWIITRKAWIEAQTKLGPLTMDDQFERHSVPEEE